MSFQKRGLGRGLSALLGDTKPPIVTGTESPVETPNRVLGAVQVRVDSVKPNPWQPRKVFEPEALAELQQSIRELGVLVPIIVRERGEGYEIIAGERRWRAAAALQLEAIPAIVRESDDRTSLEIAIVENVLRADLDPLEEAMGYAHLIEEYGYTQERVAERLGKRRSTISNTLRLLELPDAIKAELRAGTISAGHARALLALEGELQRMLAQRVVAEGLSVRDVERIASAATTDKPRSRTSTTMKKKSPDIERAESTLRYRLGTHVAIEPGVQGGRIAIRYANDEELIRVVDLLIVQ
jgi:ParB family transcriptional regulator, chromosome partitioning protein